MSCKEHRKPKRPPYGSKRNVGWCHGCDAALVPDEPSKKRERQASKAAIREGVPSYAGPSLVRPKGGPRE